MTAAGVDGSGLFAEQAEGDWMRVVDVNLGGTYRAIRAALPPTMARGAGRIIAIASVFGKMGGHGYVRAGMGIRMQATKAGPMSGSEVFDRYYTVFLARPESGGITGQALNVDGGFVMS